jgi:hypothetical protein
VVGQHLDRHAVLAGQGVIGGDGEHLGVLGDHRPEGEAGIVEHQPAHDHVDVAGQQRTHGVRQVHLVQRHRAVGVRPFEGDDQPVERRHGGRGCEAEAQLPGRGARGGAGRRDRGGQLRVGGSEPVAQLRAEGSQRHPPAGALEQRTADLTLQRGDEATDPGLGPVQALGRPPEVQLVAQDQERVDPIQIQPATSREH